MGLFGPKWVKKLPTTVGIKDSAIKELEDLRIELGLQHEEFANFVGASAGYTNLIVEDLWFKVRMQYPRSTPSGQLAAVVTLRAISEGHIERRDGQKYVESAIRHPNSVIELAFIKNFQDLVRDSIRREKHYDTAPPAVLAIYQKIDRIFGWKRGRLIPPEPAPSAEDLKMLLDSVSRDVATELAPRVKEISDRMKAGEEQFKIANELAIELNVPTIEVIPFVSWVWGKYLKFMSEFELKY